MRREFTCGLCGCCFPTETTEEEMKREADELYGPGDHGEMASLCDDCYRIFLEKMALARAFPPTESA